jgi:hypothetical protein
MNGRGVNAMTFPLPRSPCVGVRRFWAPDAHCFAAQVAVFAECAPIRSIVRDRPTTAAAAVIKLSCNATLT